MGDALAALERLQMNIASVSSSSSSPFEKRAPIPRSEYGILQLPIAMPISFNELKNATRNFLPDNILGDGKSGPVFKGWIDLHSLTAEKPGCGLTVAIRRCNHMPQFKEWLKEEWQPQHPNLIKLIAYCDEGDNKLLVHEFMPRGSLDNYLFTNWHQGLSWATRIKIAIGAARGLSFLHNAKNDVIHGNFKSSNVLLDKDFNAKVSDWGYTEHWQDQYETLAGISYIPWYYMGYAAPENRNEGLHDKSCDVYSFGVVLLELLSGRPAVEERELLVYRVRPYLSSKTRMHQVMDPKLEGKYPQKIASAVAALALQCVSYVPQRRPHMADVLAELELLQDLSERQN